MIREVALQQPPEGKAFSRLILIEAPTTTIPASLQGDVEVLVPPVPSADDLMEELAVFIDAQDVDLQGNGEERFAIANAVAGLARHEASRLFARSVVEAPTPLDPTWLRSEKAQRVATKLGGALTFESSDVPDVGGLDNLRDWLRARRVAFGSAKAREFGLPEPKGLLLLGLPGGGKSLTAKVIARDWGLPLLKFDMGRVFGSLVGQSEMQVRQAIEAAEACSPCVLWVDEIEKALAGGGNSGGGDSGTAQRVFGTLLTWLQEKTSPVFVVATANNIKGLPPELLRKGRFDEIFFVGLPHDQEREDIVRIHLARRGREFKRGSVAKVAEATRGFTGAEIEQAIIDGLFEAYANDRELLAVDVTDAATRTAPISKTMGEEIKAMETWAVGRARPASSPPEVKKKTAARRRPTLKRS